jgi:hypothetical protein
MDELLTKLRNWYITYWIEITWFIIGWLAMAMIEALSRGDYTTALIDAALIVMNYTFSKR